MSIIKEFKPNILGYYINDLVVINKLDNNRFFIITSIDYDERTEDTKQLLLRYNLIDEIEAIGYNAVDSKYYYVMLENKVVTSVSFGAMHFSFNPVVNTIPKGADTLVRFTNQMGKYTIESEILEITLGANETIKFSDYKIKSTNIDINDSIIENFIGLNPIKITIKNCEIESFEGLEEIQSLHILNSKINDLSVILNVSKYIGIINCRDKNNEYFTKDIIEDFENRCKKWMR